MAGTAGLASPAAGAAAPSVLAAAEAPASAAHRGNSSRAPENTLAAIRLAAVAGADMVDLDVNFTRDDVPVLMHDLRLERTTDGTGLLERRPYTYVKTLDAGSWFSPAYTGERVPTLFQATQLSQNLGLTVFAELKGDTTATEARRLAARWRTLGAFGTAVATSFSRTNLQRIRAAESRIRTGLISYTRVSPAEAARYGRIVFINALAITPRYVSRLHAAGLTVCGWTVDDPAGWAGLRDAGVDVVVTNRPSEYESWTLTGQVGTAS